MPNYSKEYRRGVEEAVQQAISESSGGRLVVEFGSIQEVNRVAYLVYRDLARVEGSRVLAQEQFSEAEAEGRRLPGRMRAKAKATLDAAPEQARVLRGARAAIQRALRAERENGADV
jgi:hypothetical protein